ncbi:hypothetical protein IY889_05475, partial [Campylobacter volucris]|nr:hypothetical protein [Campylobacter volucris]
MQNWDLNVLFKNEQELNLYLNQANKEAQIFRQAYENKLSTLNNENFL